MANSKNCHKCFAVIPDDSSICPVCKVEFSGETTLIVCSDCKHKLSKAAKACPHCGKPNGTAIREKREDLQGFGCLMILAGAIIWVFLSQLFGMIAVIVGAVIWLLGLLEIF